MINAILVVMARPSTFVIVTLLSLIASIYAILTVEIIDMIRLISIGLLNAILIAVQILVILLYRLVSK